VKLLHLFFAASLTVIMATGQIADGQVANKHIKNATAIGEVFGDGERITAVILEYDHEVDNAKLLAQEFSVKERNIVKVYANTNEAKAEHGANGRFVVIELNPEDKASRIIPGFSGFGGPGGQGGPDGPSGPGGPGGPGGPSAGTNGANANGRPLMGTRMGMGGGRNPVKATVTQVGDLVAVNGEKIPADHNAFETTKAKNLIVDDFQQLVFKDPENGNVVKYNLYVPRNYDKTKSYPMVLFMHDAGVDSEEHDRTLVQGLGAVVWARPEDQAKHPSFVLAPQMNGPTTSNEIETTSLADSIYHLLKYVVGQYSIDQKRLYTTGQSGGCMASIAFNIKYPDLFAASLFVAGQWNPQATAPLINRKIWIIVSEGDERAYPGMNAIVAVWGKEGAKITRGRWSAREPQDVQAANVSRMISEHNNLMYTNFIKGTCLPPEQANSGAQEHMASWQFAYDIPSVRDWLFAQSK
jgi:predicted peptidase